MSRSLWKRWIASALALAILLAAAFSLGVFAAESRLTDPVVPPWPLPQQEYMRSPTPTPLAAATPFT